MTRIERLREVIATAPRSPDEIARVLIDFGIRNCARSNITCPLAKFFTATTGAEVSVSMTAARFRYEPGEVFLSDALMKFIDRFDRNIDGAEVEYAPLEVGYERSSC